MSLAYLLDTNIASAAINEPRSALGRRIFAFDRDVIATSIIVAGEMRFGAVKNPSPRLLRQVEGFLGHLPVLDIEPPTEQRYAEIRAMLEEKGTPIGQNDLWIAAHALSLNLPLVTDNEAEFRRVDGLRIENWLRE